MCDTTMINFHIEQKWFSKHFTLSSFSHETGKFSPSVMSSKTLSNPSAPPSVDTCYKEDG